MARQRRERVRREKSFSWAISSDFWRKPVKIGKVRCPAQYEWVHSPGNQPQPLPHFIFRHAHGIGDIRCGRSLLIQLPGNFLRSLLRLPLCLLCRLSFFPRLSPKRYSFPARIFPSEESACSSHCCRKRPFPADNEVLSSPYSSTCFLPLLCLALLYAALSCPIRPPYLFFYGVLLFFILSSRLPPLRFPLPQTRLEQ